MKNDVEITGYLWVSSGEWRLTEGMGIGQWTDATHCTSAALIRKLMMMMMTTIRVL